MKIRFLPLILLLVPLAEIAVFIFVGDAIGVFPTIALIIASAILGMMLLRTGGLNALSRIRMAMEGNGDPGREVVNGFMIFLAAILLLIPGFLSDIIALILLLPFMRQGIWNFLQKRMIVTGMEPGVKRGQTIDLDETEFSSSRGKDASSDNTPWRRLPPDQSRREE